MKVSVIIVNYNVRYFLEHCLYAAQKAVDAIGGEIIVVDNHSSDGSIPYLKDRFSAVNFICSKSNYGFAKACNIGLAQARGEYILFLNPDTIIPEDALLKCVNFFEQHADCGALGVKMIDGAGNFLKESKRAFPSPLTSLYKLFGLGKVFPKSHVFNRYHLGHLDPNLVHPVDVLAGAYFMVSRPVLEQVGSFDERFFMYGEDIDLSYRIQQAGYKNYYFPDTTIIHFKGESTRRGGFNYVRMFYNAMSIFVHKHYGGTRAGIFNFSIHVAIWIRAFIAAIAKLIRWIGYPVVDALIILISFYVIKELWLGYVRTDLEFPRTLLLISFPLYTLVYLAAAYYAGLYDKYYKLSHLVRSTLIATATLLILYSLLPEKFRFSRGVVVFGALMAMTLIAFQRWLMYRSGVLQKAPNDISRPYILIASAPEEYAETLSFLDTAGLKEKVIGRVSVNGNGSNFIAKLDELPETAQVLDAREIIFCAGKLSYLEIIERVQQLQGKLTVRFHAYGGSSIVGSDTSDTSGHILSPETEFSLDKASNKRLKRMVDVVFALVALVTFPLHVFFVKNFIHFMQHCLRVLRGRATWVGYIHPSDNLPRLRPGVLTHHGNTQTTKHLPVANLQQLDYWYARNYDPSQDVKTILKNYASLGG